MRNVRKGGGGDRRGSQRDVVVDSSKEACGPCDVSSPYLLDITHK